MDIEDKIEELERRHREADLGGGEDRIAQQHAKGKMTARERIDYLLDKDSFQEIDKFVVHRCHDFGMEKKKNVNWIYSMFGEAENWGIHFREYTDLEDLARKLVSLDKKLGSDLKVRDKAPKMYNMTIAERMLVQVPGIGEKLAKDILATGHSLYAVMIDVMDNNAEGVRSVDKVGIRKAFNIKEALLEYHDDL